MLDQIRARIKAAPFVTGGDGYDAAGGGIDFASAEFFDPTHNRWTAAVAPMTVARTGHTLAPVTYQGVAGLLAAGGEANSSSGVLQSRRQRLRKKMATRLMKL